MGNNKSNVNKIISNQSLNKISNKTISENIEIEIIDVNFIYNKKTLFHRAYKINIFFETILKEFKDFIKIDYSNNPKTKIYFWNEIKYYTSEHKEINENLTLKDILNNPNGKELNIYIEVLGLLKLAKYIDKYIYENIKFVAIPYKSKIYKVILKYIINDNKFQKDLLDEELVNNFTLRSTYCNGINELFIYNGEVKKEVTPNFWKINLINNKTEKINPNIELKDLIFQSLIYIPTKYVFIIGGKYNHLNKINEDVIYYDIEEKKFIFHSKINKVLIEPSLITVDNQYLYAITYIKEIIILRLNLRSEPIWEEIKINILTDCQFDQKFFGVSKINESIIFIGGESKNKYLFGYNYEKNEIYKSNKEYKYYNFIEKTFIPISFELNILIPKIEDDNEQIGEKKNEKLAIISCNNFTHEIKESIYFKKKNKIINEIKKENDIPKVNFNMPDDNDNIKYYNTEQNVRGNINELIGIDTHNRKESNLTQNNGKRYTNEGYDVSSGYINTVKNGKKYTNNSMTDKGFNNNNNYLNTEKNDSSKKNNIDDQFPKSPYYQRELTYNGNLTNTIINN